MGRNGKALRSKVLGLCGPRQAGGRPAKEGGWAATVHPPIQLSAAGRAHHGPTRFRWEADGRGHGLQLRGFVLFRLEKVYNLVKEAMPKKPDGQSGVEGVGWAGPHPDPGSRRAAFLRLVRALPGAGVWGSVVATLLCPLPLPHRRQQKACLVAKPCLGD